jgi:hypothetical protein
MVHITAYSLHSLARSRASLYDLHCNANTCYHMPKHDREKIRMGRLIEDLDALAGTIAFKHCSVPGQQMHIVTVRCHLACVHGNIRLCTSYPPTHTRTHRRASIGSQCCIERCLMIMSFLADW